MPAFYNEFDPKAAAWLRQLIKEGHIAPGIVDERSIHEIKPEDLEGYTQCHFFAGIGGWSLALRLAGWPDDRPVGSGSCPCQPYSAAGKGLGDADHRNLWPVFFTLIRKCHSLGQPWAFTIFGEQVASSSIVGPSKPPRGLQSLQDKQAMHRILQELKRGSAKDLQRLHQSSGEGSQTPEFPGDEGEFQKMAKGKERPRFGERGQEQGQSFRDPFQPGPERHPSPDRQRVLRGDRDSVRFDNSEGLECSIVGPDSPQRGIHPGEHTGGPVCCERDGEHLGVAGDCGCIKRDSWSEEGRLEQIINEVGSMPEAEVVQCWLDGISADLEREGYACGATVLGAHSVGAPHIRQRLYWVADAYAPGRMDGFATPTGQRSETTSKYCSLSGMAHSSSTGLAGREEQSSWREQPPTERGGDVDGIPDSDSGRLQQLNQAVGRLPESYQNGSPLWSSYRVVQCRDGKTRRIPTEPALFPLAHGVSNRVGLLRGSGNAIVPQVAAEFITAFIETQQTEPEDFC